MNDITASVDLRQRQIELETSQVEQGIAKLHADIRKAESRNYSSSTVYAQKLLKKAIPEVAKEINRVRTTRLLRGKAGPGLAEMAQYTLTIDDETLAMIVLKVLFDCSITPKDRADHTVKVIDNIGSAVEQEAKWRWFKEQDPDSMERFLYYQSEHKGKGTHYRDYHLTHNMAKVGQRWTAWPALGRTKIGSALADAACSVTGWWERRTTHEKVNKSTKTKTTSSISPTPLLLEIIQRLTAQAEIFAPINLPMLVEPRDWSNFHHGGYLTNEIKHNNDLIRMFGPSPVQGEKPLLFLNHLQKVAYRINPFTLEVANRLEEDGYQVDNAKFIPEAFRELPQKPFDIATNKEAREKWRGDAREVHDHNSTCAKKCLRTKMTLHMARKFSKEERYYLPWSFDYRGRVYPIPTYLTPQDTCFGKSLIQFADGEPITEQGVYWLKFQLATTYGLDKATMEERQEWAESEEAITIIKRVAEDPISNIHLWEEVDEPFLFLAACDEYFHVVLLGDRKVTRLPVAVDATCSGLQVLAGLSHDKSTAELVNVFPGERPSDAYKAVAALVNPHIPEEWGFQLTRSDVKRVVMTIPYNAKPFSNRSYIKEQLGKRKVEITSEQLTEIVKLTRSAMAQVVPGPLNVMDWLNKEIGAAIKRGADHIEWVTPSGFVVKQDLRKTKTKRIDSHLMGRVQLNIGVGFGDPDLKHHKNAGAPNLIHSMDASILQIGLEKFESPFTVIHDSVLCGANHMDEMQAAVRKAYTEIFLHNSPLHDFAKSIGAETEPPMQYTFDPSKVEESTYFFS